MQRIQKITPCLWFDYQAEAAAGFYLQSRNGSCKPCCR
ncbi:hypothetical protein PS723_01321 [Pseudomonas fluorescens]|uniref:Uncharacterized protein n=1 Tax=Pseudomonas fluorescens TaxID=294 RepID=A0A5E7B5J0_PSEFL|nr:hypothetical protein PS723_01321 [Pseudomonas fluorescens]